MLDKISQDFSFQQRDLDLRAYRAEVLASNIANADTPYYKARDFDFRNALAAAESGQKQLGMIVTDSRHISSDANGGKQLGVDLMYRGAVQRSLDGNTVDMDIERGAFTDNAIRYQSTLTFLNKRISTLAEAIKGGQ